MLTMSNIAGKKVSRMLLEIFAYNVRYYRKFKGFSQERLAEVSGLHRTYIAGIESITRNVSLKNIEKIASALEVDPAKLLEKHDSHV